MNENETPTNPPENTAKTDAPANSPEASVEGAAHATPPSENSGDSANSSGWKAGARRRVRKQRASLGMLFGGVGSEDPSVRRMSWVFILSLIGALGLLGATGARVLQTYQERQKVQAERDAANTMSEFLTRQAEERRRRVFSSNLGEFSFELNAGADSGDADARPMGVTGLAEAEIIVECDSAEACEWIDKALPSVRHQVTIALTGVERAELSNREGKRRIRKTIADRLNQTLPRGRVLNVYFGRLVLD